MIMDRVKQLALLLLLFAALPIAQGAERTKHTKVQLVLSHEVAKPGDTVTAAIELSSAPNWHTYWRNPGDAGLPTTIEWELPAGITAGAIEWPVPHKMTLQDVGAYVYEGTEYLLIPLTIGADAKPGTFDLKGALAWLECEKVCIPQDGTIAARLSIGNQSKPSAAASIIDKARERLPRKAAPFPVTASWEASTNAGARLLVVEWATDNVQKPDFYPYEAEGYTVETASTVTNEGGKVRVKKTVTPNDEGAAWPQSIMGLVLADAAAKDPIGYEVRLTPTELKSTAAAIGAVQNSSSPPVATASIFAVLGIAFLGGLILNIMPCVLPVIALKILSFVNQSGSDPRRTRKLGLIYALGVLTSFAVLAGVIIAVQKAGGIASWGMQYQNPIFLVVMITLVTLIALNLFGVFEITLGGKALGSASELASREGASGAFFNGVLATVLGTSCTAPFLALAIGYALSQPAIITVLVFLMMGVGLAFPYVLLTSNPALLRLLPKPGAWMERFKVAMGFPMLATALWLYGVAVQAHFGTRGAFWLATFLLLVALVAWLFGTFIQRGVGRRWLASVIAVGALVFAVGFVLEKQLSWRSPVYVENSATSMASDVGINWQKWSPDAVAKARAEGRPILVDFTAAWCLNCQANKISSIEIEPVEKKMKEIGAVAMLGDFTRKDRVIAEELQKFQRSAVPLVLVYSADPDEAPRVLPELLTPGIVLEALDWAGKNKAQSSVSNAAPAVATSAR
jgi:thiol:disulfide interchange protein